MHSHRPPLILAGLLVMGCGVGSAPWSDSPLNRSTADVAPGMLALLPAQWQQRIDSSSIAVLLPRDRDVLARGTLVVQRTGYALSSSGAGVTLTVRGDALTPVDGSSFAVAERVDPDGRPQFRLELMAGRSVMLTDSFDALSARWTEHDVLYAVELRCTSGMCNLAEYLPRLLASLELAGGANTGNR